jgi:hypothetical protein
MKLKNILEIRYLSINLHSPKNIQCYFVSTKLIKLLFLISLKREVFVDNRTMLDYKNSNNFFFFLNL